MAHATIPTENALAGHLTPAATTAVQPPPVTPGKVAMWLFLATEIMFFTGLIGTYIVLRAGSPATYYSHIFPPGDPDQELHRDSKGVWIESFGPDREKVVAALHAAGLSEAEVEEVEH